MEPFAAENSASVIAPSSLAALSSCSSSKKPFASSSPPPVPVPFNLLAPPSLAPPSLASPLAPLLDDSACAAAPAVSVFAIGLVMFWIVSVLEELKGADVRDPLVRSLLRFLLGLLRRGGTITRLSAVSVVSMVPVV